MVDLGGKIVVETLTRPARHLATPTDYRSGETPKPKRRKRGLLPRPYAQLVNGFAMSTRGECRLVGIGL